MVVAIGSSNVSTPVDLTEEIQSTRASKVDTQQTYRFSTCTPPIIRREGFGAPLGVLPIFPESVGVLGAEPSVGVASCSAARPLPFPGKGDSGELAIAGCENPGMASSSRSSSSSDG